MSTKYATVSVSDLQKIRSLVAKGYEIVKQDFNEVVLRFGRTAREQRELDRRLAKRNKIQSYELS